MASNNQAIARAMDPSQSRREEIASRSRHAEITVKMAQVPDPTYTTAYRALKKFVDQQRIEGRLENGEHYITRDNIDLFFMDVVAKKINVQPEQCRRYKSGLQWYSDNREHIVEKFNLDSPAVTSALATQKANCTANQKTEKCHSLGDPLGRLSTNVIKPSETVRGMTYAINNIANWSSLGLMWTWGISTYIRNDSMLEIKYEDLMCDSTHGPEGEGIIQKMIALVLRKGHLHKDRFKRDRIVGTWRHKEYLSCPICYLAMGTMMRFFLMLIELHLTSGKKQVIFFGVIYLSPSTKTTMMHTKMSQRYLKSAVFMPLKFVILEQLVLTLVDFEVLTKHKLLL
jgi:hypothetical protein